MLASKPHTGEDTGLDAWIPTENPPPRQLSPLRVAIFFAVLAAIGYGAIFVAGRPPARAGARVAAPWFAPYVDATLTPTYAFQSPAADPVSRVFIGFVVSRSASAPCTPSWGGYYTLAGAQGTLELTARIAQLRAQGGHPMISFGGRNGPELAVGCTSVPALATAYLAPIRLYGATAIDLDVEGAALTDAAVGARRAAAIASVQRSLPRLTVWLTLPVSTSGLTPEGRVALRQMLAAHVRLAGVNALAMDFGPGQGAGHGMFTAVRSSLYALHDQVQALYAAAGSRLGDAATWHHLGVTVMIGRNDVPGETFTLADARKLTAFVEGRAMPRLSDWSLNRDSACGSVFSQLGVLSNTCSGVAQSALQFTYIFSHLPGTGVASAVAASGAPQVSSQAPDDPATSPYPIWQPTVPYDAGYKVVWHREIYEANWWSQGTAPDSGSGSTGAGSAWQLIGPVPAGARAPKPTLLVTGSHPRWTPKGVYHQGDIVSFDGLPFQARWFTQGDQPVTTLPADPQQPWTPLFELPGEPGSGR